MSEGTFAGYPPKEHFMRDLRVVFENDAEGQRMFVPLVESLQSPVGTLDLGVAATLLDMQGGGDAIAAVEPDWAVTSDMTLHLLRPTSSGIVSGKGQVLRAGRNTVVLEGELFIEGEALPVAHGQLGFTRILRREDTSRVLSERPARTDFGEGSSGFAGNFYEALGARVIDAAAGTLELAIADYHRNSLGALQGGLVVALASKAAETVGRARTGLPVVTTDLTARYLAMAKVGPVRSTARVLRRDPEALVARVELRDTGADDRLCTVVTATARLFGAEERS